MSVTERTVAPPDWVAARASMRLSIGVDTGDTVVMLNGHDVSDMLTSVAIDLEAGQPAKAFLTAVPGRIDLVADVMEVEVVSGD